MPQVAVSVAGREGRAHPRQLGQVAIDLERDRAREGVVDLVALRDGAQQVGHARQVVGALRQVVRQVDRQRHVGTGARRQRRHVAHRQQQAVAPPGLVLREVDAHAEGPAGHRAGVAHLERRAHELAGQRAARRRDCRDEKVRQEADEVHGRGGRQAVVRVARLDERARRVGHDREEVRALRDVGRHHHGPGHRGRGQRHDRGRGQQAEERPGARHIAARREEHAEAAGRRRGARLVAHHRRHRHRQPIGRLGRRRDRRDDQVGPLVVHDGQRRRGGRPGDGAAQPRQPERERTAGGLEDRVRQRRDRERLRRHPRREDQRDHAGIDVVDTRHRRPSEGDRRARRALGDPRAGHGDHHRAALDHRVARRAELQRLLLVHDPDAGAGRRTDGHPARRRAEDDVEELTALQQRVGRGGDRDRLAGLARSERQHSGLVDVVGARQRGARAERIGDGDGPRGAAGPGDREHRGAALHHRVAAGGELHGAGRIVVGDRHGHLRGHAHAGARAGTGERHREGLGRPR